jgi:hypothetical protein
VEMAWSTAWLRWDNNLYLTGYPAGFSESDLLLYSVKYSTDSGNTWFYMSDNTATATGVRPDPSHECPSGDHFDWNVSNYTQFPAGSYVIRVEGFREDIQSHYAYHQRRIFIQRD